MEALYYFILSNTAGLYRVIYRCPLFMIDYWTFVHAFSGFALMALALRLRLRRRWRLIATILVVYELFEIAFVYASVRIFLPETFPDQLTDIVVGLASALAAELAWRHRAPAGTRRARPGWDLGRAERRP